jgi:hypothetical protein
VRSGRVHHESAQRRGSKAAGDHGIGADPRRRWRLLNVVPRRRRKRRRRHALFAESSTISCTSEIGAP